MPKRLSGFRGPLTSFKEPSSVVSLPSLVTCQGMLAVCIPIRIGRRVGDLRRDEAYLDDASHTGQHERMAESCMNFSGNHESLGVLRHRPPSQDDA